MPKARQAQRYILIGGAGLLLFGFIMCCSGIRFPFFSAKSELNGHFTADFGITLPSSAVVDRAYRVAYRDQEHVFELHLAPADILVFMKALKAAVADRGYTQQE